jgi:hypothetical protein
MEAINKRNFVAAVPFGGPSAELLFHARQMDHLESIPTALAAYIM